jgi:hypothetical protein
MSNCPSGDPRHNRESERDQNNHGLRDDRWEITLARRQPRASSNITRPILLPAQAADTAPRSGAGTSSTESPRSGGRIGESVAPWPSPESSGAGSQNASHTEVGAANATPPASRSSNQPAGSAHPTPRPACHPSLGRPTEHLRARGAKCAAVQTAQASLPPRNPASSSAALSEDRGTNGRCSTID